MKVFTTFDSNWVCQLLSKVFQGAFIEAGTLEDADILFEDVYDQMKYIHVKQWKLAGLISFEPFHHFSGPYDFILCGNTEQCIGPKVVPFYMFDYLSDFGNKIPPCPKELAVPPKFACAFVSNPMCEVRNRFLQMLLELNLLDSYGNLYNNTGGPYKYVYGKTDGTTMDEIVRQYKFYICFENASHDAYISEKPLTSLRCGTIPVYFGAKTAKEYFNPKRILIPDNSSDEALIGIIRRMIHISRDDNLYKEIVREPVFISGSSSPNSLDSYASQIRNILQATPLSSCCH